MKNESIKQLLVIATIAFFIIIVAIFTIIKETSYSYSFDHLQETLMNTKALRHYVSAEQKEEVYKLQSKKTISKDYFQPQLLSSSYSAKRVNDYYNEIRKKVGLDPIVIRFAANNPRNPSNLANEYESKILEKFNKNKITEYKEIKRNNDGKKVMYYAIPSRPLEDKCMRCHSTPEKAPKDLIELYGDKNGFYEHKGDIRALISTEYPLSDVDTFIYKTTFFLGLLTFFILMIFVYFYIKFSNKVLQKNKQLENLNATLEKRVAQETQSLLKSKKQLEEVIKGSELGYWDWNLKTGYHQVNQKWLDMLGLDQDDIQHNQSDWEDRILKEDQKKIQPIIEDAIKNDKTYNIEFRMLHKNGSYIWIEGAGSVIEKDENGEPLRACGTHKDITKRKEDELELLHKNQDLKLFKKVIDSVDVGTTITQANEKGTQVVVYVNNTFEKMTGYTKEEILGKSLNVLQGEDRDQEAVKELKKAIKNHTNCEVEIRNYKKDGTLFFNFVSLSPIFNTKGELTNYIGIQHDITQLKDNETRLQQQEKLASLGEMIENIAHQWRQPLSIISTISTGTQMKHEMGMSTPEDLNKAFEEINKNTQYLSETIDHFRDYIQGESDLIEFNLTSDTKTFLNLINASIKNHNIQVILDLKEDLKVRGYPNELNQCFINIFNNAKDALLSNDKDNRFIFISQYIKDDSVVIEFKDNGGGIPKPIKDKIFEPYFTTKHKSKGTGLGLSMSYSIITNRMNGTLECENIEFECKNGVFMKGALFRITLPLQ